MRSTPLIDLRNQQAIVQELEAKFPGYVPDWRASAAGPGFTLLQIFGRYNQVLIERLNQAPDRNELAFLDMLGLNLLPAQAARAPVVFTAMPNMADGRVPAHTRLGAKVPDSTEPLIFETETDIAIVSARLAEVVAVWPGKDKYADHSTAAIGGCPFTLFTPLQLIPHELYLAHETLFALAGSTTVEIQLSLSSVGSEQLPLVWEYWQGEIWRGFKPFKTVADALSIDSFDGTEGFTRSGIVRLVTDCADAKKLTVNGVESFWIRARSEKALPDSVGRNWPVIDRIGVRSGIAKPRYKFILTSQTPKPGSAGKVSVHGPVFIHGEKSELYGPHFSDSRTTQQVDMAAEWNGLAAGQYRLLLKKANFAPFDCSFALPGDSGLELLFHGSADGVGVEAEAAYFEGQKLDLTKAFFPFGQQPQAGNCFYIKSTEAFSKPGAHITLAARVVPTPRGDLEQALSRVSLVVEAWDGERWLNLNAPKDPLALLFASRPTDEPTVEFDLPNRVASTSVNGEEGYWLRVRITWGGFARLLLIGIPGSFEKMTIVEYVPMPIENLRIFYDYSAPMAGVEACLTRNDFQWQNHTRDANHQGSPFTPFVPVEDRTPALYFGFDAPLPADLVSLFLDIEEVPGETRGPALRWEYWDGLAWLPLAIKEETQNLALPGMLSILWPGVPGPPPATVSKAGGKQIQLAEPRDGLRFLEGDQLFIEQDGKGELTTVASSAAGLITAETALSKDYANAQVSRAKLPRFGTPRTWVRARLQEDNEPRLVKFNGIYLNGAWAAQVQTFENEVLGSSNGQLNQVQFLRNTPVLPGQAIEVRELEGARARVELPLLIQDLEAHGMSAADLRTVTDRRTGEISQVWVRWQERPNLFFSGPGDRHYVIERSRGRIGFGDNRHGRIPRVAADCILARYYRSGGGLQGNVSAGAIKQVLAGVLAKGVTNPRAAEGGADGEEPAAVLDRGPLVVRTRLQAIACADYEAVAREASPAVAVARALPATHPTGRFEPGWVKLVIMPHSHDPKPQPSFQLRLQVENFVAARMPASIAGQIYVVGPEYLEVGVVAAVAPESMERAGAVLEDVTRGLQEFLNPLNGGPNGKGWPLGRDVYLSDVASMIEAIAGVDYISTLELTLGGTPRGEVVEVPDDRIVVAGPLRVTLTGTER